MTSEEAAAFPERVLNLNELVKTATWRELLLELVESKKIDPWDIDISLMATEYVNAVRQMQLVDLRVPANIILAASILLRLKSDSIPIFQQNEEIVQDEPHGARVAPVTDELVPKLRIQPRRRISLGELMAALDEVIKIGERRELREAEISMPIKIEIEKDDIDKKIDDAHKIILRDADAEGVVRYSALARYFASPHDALRNMFIPVLFLAHRKILRVRQDEFFGEIFLIIDGNNGASVG